MNLILFIFETNIILKAMADGLKYKDHNEANVFRGIAYHTCDIVSVFALIFLMFECVTIQESYSLIVGYALLRFGLFDFVYNICAGQNSLYIGYTSLYDKVLRRLFPTPNKKVLMAFLKGVSVIIGAYLVQYPIQF